MAKKDEVKQAKKDTNRPENVTGAEVESNIEQHLDVDPNDPRVSEEKRTKLAERFNKEFRN